ncbi:MAG: hypothetical protein KF833_23875 [Verrucomicrobiae bacterium]|nr:hypothetical protein [Verrucomicrobiae bacterium]
MRLKDSGNDCKKGRQGSGKGNGSPVPDLGAMAEGGALAFWDDRVMS